MGLWVGMGVRMTERRERRMEEQKGEWVKSHYKQVSQV